MVKMGLPWWLSGKKNPLPVQETQVDPWSGKVPHASRATKSTSTQLPSPELWSPGAATTKAIAPYNLCMVMREAILVNSCTATESSPHLRQGRENPVCSNEDLAQMETSKDIFFNLRKRVLRWSTSWRSAVRSALPLQGQSLIPGQGTNISHTVWVCQKKKKKMVMINFMLCVFCQKKNVKVQKSLLVQQPSSSFTQNTYRSPVFVCSSRESLCICKLIRICVNV